MKRSKLSKPEHLDKGAETRVMLVFRPKALRLGAQEKDTQHGIDLYRGIFDSVIEVEFDFARRKLSLIYPGQPPTTPHIGRTRGLVRFLILKTVISDPAMRKCLNLKIARQVRHLQKTFQPDVVLSETSSLLPLALLTPKAIRYSRSVNFEPLHHFTENPNYCYRLIGALLKFPGVWLERLFTRIIAISEFDALLYRRLTLGKRLEVVPLRGLAPAAPFSKPFVKPSHRQVDFGLFASTFNVSHNKRNVKFFCHEVFPFVDKGAFLTIFGSKVPQSFSTANIAIAGWVPDIETCYRMADIFLASYQGGTGMQSKVFEPLTRGKLVICDPRLTSHSSLIPHVHFLPARSPEDFIKWVTMVAADPSAFSTISENALEWSRRHLSDESIRAQLIRVFQE